MWSRYYEDFIDNEEDPEDFLNRRKEKEEEDLFFALSDEAILYSTI